MTALAGFPLVSAAEAAQPARAAARTLVVYFSRSGNTRVVAGLIQRAFDAEILEIRPATPYPDEYLATVKQATDERDRDFAPPLAGGIADLSRWQAIYLGFPVWGETVPSPVRSFLKAHDLAGKTVTPFVTHGGYGLGRSQDVLIKLAPQARWQEPFSMQADQERQTMNTVNNWLGRGASPPQ